MEDKDLINKYLSLIRRYTDGEMSSPEFQETFLKVYREEKECGPKETFEILERMWGEVEMYCSDPNLRQERDNDEQDLLDAAKEIERRLEEIE